MGDICDAALVPALSLPSFAKVQGGLLSRNLNSLFLFINVERRGEQMNADLT
jgi:hypothetical protein